MSGGNGHDRNPTEFLELRYPEIPETHVPLPLRRRRPWLLALILFLLTVFSTLAVGAQFVRAFAVNQPPFSSDANPFSEILLAFAHPRTLLLGIPFSFTLLGILLAHELGHYFACRLYSIDASYPYFIPAPTIIGTMGAFIRIRSPIINRKALFDVGLSGPVVGFLFAVPALVLGIMHSKVVPGAQSEAAILFGNPPLVKALVAFCRPGVAADSLLLHPVARAAWVGLFATAFNLIPAGQLDGGHIVYSLASEKHRQISLTVAVILFLLGVPAALHSFAGVAMPTFFADQWPGWTLLGMLLLLLGFRHPPLLDRREPLDPPRRAWAIVALLIFFLCLTPVPFSFPSAP
jgi:membrane-associated protease RseP (regulator of RpoE activity)